MTVRSSRLFGPGAHAVLIGTAAHRAGSVLGPLPAVETTLDDVEAALRDLCGLTGDRIHRVSPYASSSDVVATVERLVDQAEGVVLLYYAGHGILGPKEDLHLATWASQSDQSVAHAVPYRTLADLLGNARHGSIVVLDCCYSGRAAVPAGSQGDPFVHPRPQGSVLLSAASRMALAYSPPGQPHTLFSGRLLGLLTEGDPTGPPDLTLDSIYQALSGMPWEGDARPRLQSDGPMGAAVLTRNRAYPERPEWKPLPPAPGPCPYPGMGAFKAAEAGYFFGREQFTERVIEAVCSPERRGPLLLVGASGAGKSSLLRAGLLAGLADRRALRPGEVPWPVMLLAAPGARPLELLAGRWAQATGRAPDDVLRMLSEGVFPTARPGYHAPRLLVVDQFEEVFTRCEDQAERERFIQLLVGLGGPPDGPGRPRVVLALQADHYGAVSHPALYPAAEHGVLNLPPLGPAELRAAIEGPAREAGLTLEDGLTDRLLHDLRHGRDDEQVPPLGEALPFLAHALHNTWVNRSGHVLTLWGYQCTGGIWQSVRLTAQQLHDALDEPHRAVLRELLLRMVSIGPDGEAVRRRIDPADLLDGRPAAEQQMISEVLDRLTRARLVVRNQDGAELAHEALLRAWKLLGSWLRDFKAELLAHQRLAELAERWAEHDRKPDYLVKGDQLAQVRPRPDRDRPGAGIALTALERDFLEACVEAERRGRRRGVALSVGAIGLVMAVLAALVVAWFQRDLADTRASEVRSKRIAAVADALRSADPAAAMELSLAAFRTSPTVEARSALLRSALTPAPVRLEGHTKAVLNLAFDKEGRTLASSSADRTVRTWNVEDPVHPRVREVLQVDGTATIGWRPDGRYLFAQAARQLYVWDMADPNHAREVARAVPAESGMAYGSAVSPDGRTFAVATDQGLVLWDLTDPSRPRAERAPGPEGAESLNCVAFHPDGRTLAVGVRGGNIRLWNLTEQRTATPATLIENTFAMSVAISPDGRTLAGGSIDTGVKAWDITDRDHPRNTLSPFDLKQTLPSLSFRGDSGYLAAAGWDGRVRLFAVQRDGDLSAEHELPSEDVRPLGLRPDLATLKPGDRAKAPLPPFAVQSVAYRADNRGLAVGRYDGGIRLWNPLPSSVPDFASAEGAVAGSILSSEGRYYVGTSADAGAARIWQVGRTGGDSAATAPVLVTALPEPWVRARFLPGREALISQDRDGRKLKLWDFTGGKLRPGQEFDSTADDGVSPGFSFGPGGRLLALHRPESGDVDLWDVGRLDQAQQVGTIRGAGDQVTLAFTGPHSVALLRPQETQFWDVTDPRQPRRTAQVAEPPQSLYNTDNGWLLVTAPLLDPRPGRVTIGEKAVRVWSSSDGDDGARVLGTTAGEGQTNALLSDRLLAMASEKGRPALLELPEFRPVALQGGLVGVTGFVADREHKQLVGWKSKGGGSLTVWRMPSGDGPAGAEGAELLASTEGLRQIAGLDLGSLSVLGFTPEDGAALLAFDSDLLKALDVAVLIVPMDLGKELPATLCRSLPDRMTEARWKELLPGVARTDPCS